MFMNSLNLNQSIWIRMQALFALMMVPALACSSDEEIVIEKPSIVSKSPVGSNVSPDEDLVIEFSVPMNPATVFMIVANEDESVEGLSEPTLTIESESGEIVRSDFESLVWSNNVKTLTLDMGVLNQGDTYTVSLSSEVRAAKGESLDEEISWTFEVSELGFTDEDGIETRRGSLTRESPLEGDVHVPIDTYIRATFGSAMDINQGVPPLCFGEIEVCPRNAPSCSTALIAGSGSWADDGLSFTFQPDTPLEYATEYSVLVCGELVTNTGVPLASGISAVFETARAPVGVFSSLPNDQLDAWPTNSQILIDFATPMNTESVESAIEVSSSGELPNDYEITWDREEQAMTLRGPSTMQDPETGEPVLNAYGPSWGDFVEVTIAISSDAVDALGDPITPFTLTFSTDDVASEPPPEDQ